MQVKSLYRGIKLARSNVSNTMRQMQIENPYQDNSGIGGKHHKNPNKPAMPERQDLLTQIRQLESSIRKDQRRLANGLALRKPASASATVQRIAQKRERIMQLLDTLNARLAMPSTPDNEPVYRPAKIKPDTRQKPRPRWSNN